LGSAVRRETNASSAGGTVETLAETTFPFGLAMDTTHVYWTDAPLNGEGFSPGAVFRVSR